MSRWVGIVLIIVGLIFQPVVAAVPNILADYQTGPVVSLNTSTPAHADTHDHHAQEAIHKNTQASCHKNAANGEPSSSAHDSEHIDCLNSGTCASLCVLSAGAVSSVGLPKSNRQATSAFLSISTHPGFNLLSRIYHPPKVS